MGIGLRQCRSAAAGVARTSVWMIVASGASLAWSFLPSITVPIFQAGRLQADLDVLTLQKDIDVARYEKAIQTAFREVADGLAERGTYSDQVASLERVASPHDHVLLPGHRFLNFY